MADNVQPDQKRGGRSRPRSADQCGSWNTVAWRYRARAI